MQELDPISEHKMTLFSSQSEISRRERYKRYWLLCPRLKTSVPLGGVFIGTLVHLVLDARAEVLMAIATRISECDSKEENLEQGRANDYSRMMDPSKCYQGTDTLM